ncbi:Y_Y_Y domain-containing protein [Polaribacter sp. KT25b]|uniref:sensor histidine kinase n=1 Tax=Polaribacter sp. KT25b TaxID=1855336 RepID=UPI00087D0BA6|nr:histidine kinase [Polaribacter sp. KT25b]SDS39392.1 Y_Y_Y domain-containing protein [Polaribacter sp. KT25b]
MLKIYKNIVFVVLLSFSALYSQNPVVENMSSISNLPDIEFYDVLEDQDHFIWLAADKGLYRYDGKSYKHFSNPIQKSNSLFQLKLDKEGRLWCNNINGQIFYVEKDRLKLFYDANLFVKAQLSLYVILENKIRLFTTQGVFDIYKKDKKVSKILDGMALSMGEYQNESFCFAVDKEKNRKLNRVYKITENSVKIIFEVEGNKHIQSPKVFAFKEEVLFTFKKEDFNQIYHINKENETSKLLITPSILKHLTIYNIVKIEEHYWFLTTSGVFVFKLEAKKLKFVEQLFETESITDVEVDFNKNYWFTTLDNGVFVSPSLSIRRVALTTLKDKITAACTLNKNNFLLGTNTGKLLLYNHSKLVKTIELPGSKIIGNLFYDANKEKLIVSINASESYIVNLKNNAVKDVKNKFSVAKSFAKVDHQNLFYGNYKEGIVYKNPYLTSEKKSIRSSRVKTSMVTNNSLFVSYIDGLFIYDLNTFSSKELKFNNKSVLVNSIVKTNNTIWLATQHNGLLQLKNNKLQHAPFVVSDKIQINEMKSDGIVLWISTDDGLHYYSLLTHQIKRLSAQDGLNVLINKFLVLEDYLIVLLSNSFYILPKNERFFKTYKTAAINIEAVAINDKDTLVTSNYNLAYYNNKIRLDFNSNGFQSNKHVSYRYRVKQLDTVWSKVPLNNHFVTFNSLPSGTYTFELEAKNISSEKAVLSDPITFVIHKPFWETYWFFTIVLLLFFGLIWFYFKWKLKQKEKQRILEIDKILIDKKIAHLRLENLRSQMNPHFIFNALNSIQDYIVSNKKELASSYLVKFSRLIRMYLDYSQQNEITLQEELSALQLYLELEKVRFEDELSYKIKIDKRLQIHQIKVPSLFIQPYVENALKHGLLHKLNNRKLMVEAKLISQNKVQILVEDNGIGRQQSAKIKRQNQKHKPFATKANQERVHLYKNKLKRDINIQIKDLKDKNKLSLGTKVIINISIQ